MALIANDWKIDTTTNTIRYIGTTTGPQASYVSALELHQWLQGQEIDEPVRYARIKGKDLKIIDIKNTHIELRDKGGNTNDKVIIRIEDFRKLVKDGKATVHRDPRFISTNPQPR